MLKWASVSLDITRVPLWCGECKFVINYQSVFLSSSPLSHYFLTLLCGAPPTPIVHVTHWRRAKWFVVRAVVQKWWYSYNGGATSISSPRLLWQSIEKLEKIKNIPLIKFLKGSFISISKWIFNEMESIFQRSPCPAYLGSLNHCSSRTQTCVFVSWAKFVVYWHWPNKTINIYVSDKWTGFTMTGQASASAAFKAEISTLPPPTHSSIETWTQPTATHRESCLQSSHSTPNTRFLLLHCTLLHFLFLAW